jgi:nucleoid DNA-binding protein
MIARMSTISTADTMAMLEAFLTVVPDLLTEGKIVELGEFGTFPSAFRATARQKPMT